MFFLIEVGNTDYTKFTFFNFEIIVRRFKNELGKIVSRIVEATIKIVK